MPIIPGHVLLQPAKSCDVLQTEQCCHHSSAKLRSNQKEERGNSHRHANTDTDADTGLNNMDAQAQYTVTFLPLK